MSNCITQTENEIFSDIDEKAVQPRHLDFNGSEMKVNVTGKKNQL